MCILISYMNEEKENIIGRNFDWIQKGGKLHILPPSRSYGFNTLGLAIIEQMGEDMPYEGINEKGLFIGMAAVMDSEIKTFDSNMNSLGVMKYILERAETSEDAITLIKNFKLDYLQDKGFPKVHYMIADRSGQVGVYEQDVYDKLSNLNPHEGEVITNFTHQTTYNCERSEKVREQFKNQIKSEEEMKALLEEVKQEELTVYSSIFNLDNCTINLYLEQDYETEYSFNLIDEIKKGKSIIEFGELRLPKFLSSQQM